MTPNPFPLTPQNMIPRPTISFPIRNTVSAARPSNRRELITAPSAIDALSRWIIIVLGLTTVSALGTTNSLFCFWCLSIRSVGMLFCSLFFGSSFAISKLYHSIVLLTFRSNCGTPFQNIHIIFLLVESILFGMFTICMLADQLESVSTNMTQIDRLKGAPARSSSVDIAYRIPWIIVIDGD